MKKIITTYTRGKSLIDSYRMNNEILQKYEQLFFIYNFHKDFALKSLLEAAEKILIEYSKGIKKQHEELKNNVISLLNRIKKSDLIKF